MCTTKGDNRSEEDGERVLAVLDMPELENKDFYHTSSEIEMHVKAALAVFDFSWFDSLVIR